jgi:phosphate:Na+ symporter
VGVLALVATGIVMTTVMQSSTAAITVTISALFAGAINLDQALALVIGQNIGTSTSSAMAAIGASSTAKRLAAAYVAFKVIAAVVTLVLFPVVVRLMLRASESVDPVTLVAAYHTAYNVMGVAILLPLIGPFTRVIERIVPERVSIFARSLDPAALAGVPTVAVEAVRCTVARVLDAICTSANTPGDGAMVREASAALNQAREFLSKVTEPLVSEQEQQWLISTVHALDHTVGLAEATQESAKIDVTLDSPDERRAMKLYTEAMQTVAEVAGPMARASVLLSGAAVFGARPGDTSEAVNRLARCSNELANLRVEHRRTTLGSVAAGGRTASDAIAQVEAIRLLDQRTHHAWRATAHLAAAVA